MPPAVAVAAVAAGGQLASTALQSHAAARAQRGQQKATGAAFRVERDREAKQWDAYNAAMQRRTALQDALLGRYGISLPRPGGAPAPAPSLLPTPSTPAPGPAMSTPAPAAPTLTGQPAAVKPAPSIMPEGYGLVAPPPEPDAPPSWSSWGRPR